VEQEGVVKRSISDDDLCSDCKLCRYNPGGMSECESDWPGLFDANGYCVECVHFIAVEKRGDNWELTDE
jgi:hypothetical protein